MDYNLIFPRMCVLFKIKAVVLYKKYLSGRWFESNLVFKCLNGIHIVPTTWYSFFVYLGRFSKKKPKKKKPCIMSTFGASSLDVSVS